LGDNPDLDALVAATLGPALARLSTVYPTRQSYLDFWRAHPALKEDWNADIEAYLDYDVEPVEGGFRSRVKPEAVMADSREVARPDLTAGALDGLRCHVALLRAPRDLLDRPSPLIPQQVVDEWQRRLPNLSAQLVDDVNHYTLMFAERGTAAIAALVGPASGPAT
jgi:hypothetical protein